MNDVLIIAEAGVNHNGDINLAKELVSVAAEAGADIVKFQTFKADKFVTKAAEKAKYQKENSGVEESQYEMLKKLELDEAMHFEIIECCKENNIKFMSTAFDFDSLELLADKFNIDTLKIPSGELTNAPLVLAHAQKKRDLILSTGMATIKEIEECLGVIAFGFTASIEDKPNPEAFREAYASNVGQKLLHERVSILHCTTEYPAPINEVNLNVLRTLGDTFGLPIGYSDHTEGIIIPIAAAALSATIIEKHFTLDKNMEGPDHKASLDPIELKEMVSSIRTIENAMGDGIKKPQKSELANINIARKSIVAELEINAGEIIKENMISIKRPGTGKSPYTYWDVIGSISTKNYKPGDLIKKN